MVSKSISPHNLDQDLLLISDKLGFYRFAYLQQGDLKRFRYFQDDLDKYHIGDLCLGRISEYARHLSGYFITLAHQQTAFLPESQLKYHSKTQFVIGETLLVQIDRLAITAEDKPARVVLRHRLAAIDLVYCPAESGCQFSSKLMAPNEERQRLTDCLQDFMSENQITGGFILRQSAAGQSEQRLIAQAKLLTQIWHAARQSPAVTEKNNVSFSQLRQLLAFISDIPSLDSVWLEQRTDRYWHPLLSLIAPLLPQSVFDKSDPFAQNQPRIHSWQATAPLMTAHGIQTIPAEIADRRYELETGGWISFDITPVMTLIDVNSGTIQAKSADEKALKTNLAALTKIHDLLQIRGFQGQLAIDLIPVKQKKSREICLSALKKLCHSIDPTPRYHLVPDTFLVILSGRGNHQFQDSQNLGDSCPTCQQPHHRLSETRLRGILGLFYNLEMHQQEVAQLPDLITRRGQNYDIYLTKSQLEMADSPTGQGWCQQWQQSTGLHLTLHLR